MSEKTIAKNIINKTIRDFSRLLKKYSFKNIRYAKNPTNIKKNIAQIETTTSEDSCI